MTAAAMLGPSCPACRDPMGPSPSVDGCPVCRGEVAIAKVRVTIDGEGAFLFPRQVWLLRQIRAAERDADCTVPRLAEAAGVVTWRTHIVAALGALERKDLIRRTRRVKVSRTGPSAIAYDVTERGLAVLWALDLEEIAHE